MQTIAILSFSYSTHSPFVIRCFLSLVAYWKCKTEICDITNRRDHVHLQKYCKNLFCFERKSCSKNCFSLLVIYIYLFVSHKLQHFYKSITIRNRKKRAKNKKFPILSCFPPPCITFFVVVCCEREGQQERSSETLKCLLKICNFWNYYFICIVCPTKRLSPLHLNCYRGCWCSYC